MKKFFVGMAFAVAVAAMQSCASYTNSAAVKTMSPTLITNVEADIDYASQKKVNATVESKKLFGFISLTRNGNKLMYSSNNYRGLSKAERQALYRAKENSGADLIIEPEFTTEKHSWFFGAYKTQKVSVNGWGVKMKGIKDAR